jgi:hypothetical protein
MAGICLQKRIIRMNNLPSVVKAIEQIDLSGNMIPASWYHEIKTDKGKTALLAINILSDIVYWYKPSTKRDETTGRAIGKYKKFKSDKLQKKYQHYADFFGVPKSSIVEAIDLLVNRGIITREFRTIKINGIALNNVMFLEPVPEKIKEITFKSEHTDKYPDTLSEENQDSLSEENSDSLLDKNTYTYTQNTTEITTEITTNTKNSIPAKAGNVIIFPASLKTDEFSTAWKEWKQYRSQIRKKLTDMTQTKQLKMLEKFGSTIAVAMIEQSISSGWQGLFELKKENEPLSLGIRN